MWVRKSAKEMRKRLLWSFGCPLFCSFLVAIVPLSMTGHPSSTRFPQFSQAPGTVSILILIAKYSAIITFLSVYFYQLYTNRVLFSGLRKVWICDMCNEEKISDGKRSCDCGGRFEDIELWKWLD
jgi:hypothetical protein